MIISHVKIIAFQLSLFCKNYRSSKTVLYIINRKIHGCLEDLFLVLNMISHSFAALTREISCSTLEINLVFPRTHVFNILYINSQFLFSVKLWPDSEAYFTLYFQNILNITNFGEILLFPSNFLRSSRISFTFPSKFISNSWEICCRCAEKLLAHAIFYKNSKI
jgi:hypothetical protein